MAKEKICGIYCIENLVNHKRYIGLSTDIDSRWKTHKRKLNGNSHVNEHLQSAWNKYGENNFDFSIIEKCKEENIKEREKYYISLYNTQDNKLGYNKTSGGDGIKDLSEECSEKISISETMYPVVCLTINGDFVKEYRNCAKAAIDLCGRTENIRQCCNKEVGYKTQYGFIWMYKTDYENGLFNKSYYIRGNNSKEIDVYDLSGNYINTYSNAREIDKELGIPYRNVSQVCNGQKRQSHGYICRFKGDSFDKYPTTRKDGKTEALR